MWTTIAIAVPLVIVILVIAVASKPATFTVGRSGTINAPAAKIFPLVNDFHAWDAWSPWEKLDPNLKRTFEGPSAGKGAIYGWEGNKQVGQGRMEILESTPNSKILIKLDFLKPFEAHNTAEFTFTEQAGGTEVNWVMRGNNTTMTKIMQLFFSMDKMVGKDFEKGLAQMKATAEK